jgi:hypothetical protein
MLFTNINKDLNFIISFAILLRILVFILAIFINPQDQKKNSLSPLVEQKGIDTPFYQKAAEQYKNYGLTIIYKKTKSFLDELLADSSKASSVEPSEMSPLPLFPLTLIAFDYKQGNTLPLAILYLIMSIAFCIIWLKWLSENGLPKWSLWVFTIIPSPIYYMLAISTDMMFAFFFSIFFTSYFRTKNKENYYVWIFALICMTFLRPNVISVILFILFDKLFFSKKKLNIKSTQFIFLAVAILTTLALVSLPYFLVPIGHNLEIDYFGIQHSEYFSGIFNELPHFLNKIISVISLILAKVFYFVGLRPSWSEIPDYILFIRSFTGIFLLPGILYLYIKGDIRIKILFGFFILPILLVVTQDRYNLPVFPILYFYGVIFFNKFLLKVRLVNLNKINKK